MKRVRLRGVAFAVAVLLVAGCSSGMGTVEGQVVWGATAMILSEFLELVDVEHLPNFR